VVSLLADLKGDRYIWVKALFPKILKECLGVEGQAVSALPELVVVPKLIVAATFAVRGTDSSQREHVAGLHELELDRDVLSRNALGSDENVSGDQTLLGRSGHDAGETRGARGGF